jgi:hypothetical protein
LGAGAVAGAGLAAGIVFLVPGAQAK